MKNGIQVAKFVKGRKGVVCNYNYRTAFPDRRAWRGFPQPKAGENWLVEAAGENPRKTVYFLRPIGRIPGKVDIAIRLAEIAREMPDVLEAEAVGYGARVKFRYDGGTYETWVNETNKIFIAADLYKGLGLRAINVDAVIEFLYGVGGYDVILSAMDKHIRRCDMVCRYKCLDGVTREYRYDHSLEVNEKIMAYQAAEEAALRRAIKKLKETGVIGKMVGAYDESCMAVVVIRAATLVPERYMIGGYGPFSYYKGENYAGTEDIEKRLREFGANEEKFPAIFVTEERHRKASGDDDYAVTGVATAWHADD